jgi:hypothetical protein
MSNVRVIDRPRIEVDFCEDTPTLASDHEKAIQAYRSAAEAARTLGWSHYHVSVRKDEISQCTVALERDDEPR